MPGIRDIYKAFKSRRLAGRISAVRRIDRVAPPPGKRMVAITFDDGPTLAPARPGQRPITPSILDTLKAYGAKGTFDVIGTTRFRYPDRKGENGGPYWNGVHHDHYPEFGQDHLGGVVALPDLVRRIADEGHEISNHGMTHTAFGPQYYPYMNRRFLPGIDAVVRDLAELHDLVERVSGQRMRLGRPAHYIDKTADGFDAYDAYGQMGYLYLGASFDGGGWRASCGDYARDVDAMVAHLESTLTQDPSALNGQIIFHKDGYNMSSEAPAVEGLERQLEVLKSFEYQVVTVSQLLAESEFSDIGPGHPRYSAAALLARRGYPVTFADNCVRPDRVTTVGEIAKMVVPVVGLPGRAGGERRGCGEHHEAGGHSEGEEPFAVGDNRFIKESAAANQEIVNALTFSPSGEFRPFLDRRQVSLPALAAACRKMVQDTPMSEDGRNRRLSLLSERSRQDGDEPATRGQAISLLAAALFGE